MADVPQDEKAKEEQKFYAEIGKAALSIGNTDITLVAIVNILLKAYAKVPMTSEASIFIYSARSIDQKFEITRKLMELRFRPNLKSPTWSHSYRIADHIFKLFNGIKTQIDRTKWIRNLAAHGNVKENPGQPIKLIPPMLDSLEIEAFQRKRANYKDGLTAEDIATELVNVTDANKLLFDFAALLKATILTVADEKYLEAARKLSKDLQIPLPKLQKPRRERG